MNRKAFGTYEIAEICHVSPSTVGEWVDKGLFPIFKTGGGHRRVWEDDLLKFLEKLNIPVPENMFTSESVCILIVDDEEELRKSVVRVLQNSFSNVTIHEASDGFDAGQKVMHLLPDLIILDLVLPGLNGFKVCQMIRFYEDLRKAKIIAISGHNVEEFSRLAVESGADDFLGKPLEVSVLEKKVMKLMGHRIKPSPKMVI